MLPVQVTVCLALWLGYGVVQARRSAQIRSQVRAVPLGRRGILGGALFLVGGMVLIGGLGIVFQQGGFTASGMTLPGWLSVACVGLLFVHAQTLGMALLVSLVQENVTNKRGTASINRTKEDSP